jgi:long-chain acyl-CoA synthetase
MNTVIHTEGMSLGEMALAAAAKYRKRPAFEVYRDGGVYGRLSYGEFGLLARRFAALLGALGVGRGDRVLILSENRPEWPAAYFGIALAGAVAAPLLTGFAPGQIRAIAEHAGAAAVCQSERYAGKIAGAGLLPEAPRIFIDSIEEGSILVSLGGREKRLPLPEPGNAGGGGACSGVRDSDCAAIIYTSGTTGSSKGVMLSHRNLLFTAAASRSLMKIFSRDRLLSVLPLAHTYECTLGLLTAVMSGASVSYLDKPPAPAVLFQAIRNLRPTAMVTVPLFIEKIYRSLALPCLEKNPFRRFPPARFLAERLAGRKLGAAFGGALRFFGVGGAPLAEDAERFLRRAQFPYSPGYGLTEAAPLVTGTAPYRFPFRSTGRPVRGVEVRIVPPGDGRGGAGGTGGGEIQVRGPNVMMGYYRDEEGTREAFTPDGWLKTGDLGVLDKRGRLFVRGRLKTLILGPSGENIYPEEIEGLLLASDLVEEALVLPGDRGTLRALVVLSEAAGTPPGENGARRGEEGLGALKDEVNRRLPPFSRLSGIGVRETPFEKTPTGKIKRYLFTGGEGPGTE